MNICRESSKSKLPLQGNQNSEIKHEIESGRKVKRWGQIMIGWIHPTRAEQWAIGD